jgi:alkaline phosphatase D
VSNETSPEKPGPTGEPALLRSSRRGFLKSTALTAAALATGCGGAAMGDDDGGGPDDAGIDRDSGAPMDASQPDGGAEEPDAGPPPEPLVPPEETPEATTFGLGVASGDVLPTAAMVWTRHDGDTPLALVAWEMDGTRYERQLPTATVTRADGGFVHHELTGLAPGRRYRYAFFEVDGATRLARSPVGAFRAALAPDALDPLVVGAVSCTTNSRSKETLERAGARDDLDVFLCLGDTTYNDGASTRSEYRDKWAESLGSAGWRAVRRATSVLTTWDDHEVDNNFDPERLDLAIPTQVLFENMPLRRTPAAPDRLWKSMRWGRTAEIFVLDGRSERLRSTRGGDDVYLSRAQMDWLKGGLMESPCLFKLIANSVPIGDFPFPAAEDRWEGYPTQRTEILSFIDDNAIDGVLWISGDFHFASIGRVSPSGPGATQTEVLAGPGAQFGNPANLLCRPPQFDWTTTTNNYTSFELLPSQRRIRVRWHDRDGSVIRTAEIDYP